jgi:hypothetical protein
VTSISDLQQGNLSLRLRRLSAWALRRGRPVLPQYEAERSTWWATLRRLLLLAAIGFVSVFYGLLVSVLPPVLLMPFSVPLVVLGLLVIWALPELPRAPLRALSASFLIFFVLMLLWPNYLAFSFAGLPWISVRRLVGGIASALLLINISVSVDMRTKMRAMLKESKLISTFLIGFAAVQFVSVIFSDGLSGTIARYIDYQIIWIAMFFIAVWFFGEQKNIDRWFRYIITVTIILIIIGALEFSQKHVLWVGYIPSFLQVNDDAVQQILTPGYRGLYRVVTTFSTPLSWGEYIAVASAFVLHGLMQAKTVKSRLIWGAFDIIALLSAFLSGARLAMVGFIVAHAVYFFIWGARTWRLKPGGLIGPAVTLMYPAIMVAAGTLIMSVNGLRYRVFGGGQSQSSNDARHEQFQMAMPALAQRPLFGYGPGQGGQAIGWRNMAGEISVDSGYLTIAVDYGLLGFSFFYGMIVVAMLRTGWAAAHNTNTNAAFGMALSTSFAVLLTTRIVLSQGDNNPLVFMLLGLAVAFLYHQRRDNKAEAGQAAA